MAQPGWYPDPVGTPGEFRYWDGTTWSADTSATPGLPPEPPTKPRPARRSGAVVVLVAVVAIMALVVWRAGSGGSLGGSGDAQTDSPTVSAWDETATNAPGPSSPGSSAPACSDTQAGTDGKVVAGRMQSGRLTAPTISTWEAPKRPVHIRGFTQSIGQIKTITSRWESSSLLATAARSDFPTAQQAARGLIDCLIFYVYFRGFTGAKTVSSEPFSVDGHPGHRIRVEVTVDNEGPDIPGDVLDLIVVDTGDPDAWGIYLATVTIGDQVTQADVDAVIGDLHVA